jgi:hypothetical protein
MWCRRQVENEKVADMREVEVHGLHIRPTYRSLAGRFCKSIQGWVVREGHGAFWRTWFKSKREAVEFIERVFRRWNEDGAVESQGLHREQMRRLWGDTEASVKADREIAAKVAEEKARAVALASQVSEGERFRKYGAEMLAALKWAEKVILMNIPNDAPEYTGRNQSLEAIRMAIAKAEGRA